jgi:hypothetical protein
MACPSCDHTMHAITKECWHCPRCGTVKLRHQQEVIIKPALIHRVRELLDSEYQVIETAIALGVVEAVGIPTERKARPTQRQLIIDEKHLRGGNNP